MTAIDAEEIDPGLVAFLDPDVLAADDRVSNTKDPPMSRSGPFVCVSVEDETCEWMPITTQERQERIEIPAVWRSGGHPQWLRDDQYLNDGANIWRGPRDAFANASQQELTDEGSRARVSSEALTAIRQELEAQRNRRDRP